MEETGGSCLAATSSCSEQEAPPLALALPALDLDLMGAAAGGGHAFPVAPRKVTVLGQVVHFDGCTHSSGIQRGYVSCPNLRHPNCFKYRQIDQFADWQECAAWLALWLRDGKHEEIKQDHTDFEPYPDEVQAARATLLG